MEALRACSLIGMARVALYSRPKVVASSPSLLASMYFR
jgi:hypothetical protein